tara:strand:- start:923 stop:1093 length:171 start_codon:yes stop_codon:yes gene_type:complete
MKWIEELKGYVFIHKHKELKGMNGVKINNAQPNWHKIKGKSIKIKNMFNKAFILKK